MFRVKPTKYFPFHFYNTRIKSVGFHMKSIDVSMKPNVFPRKSNDVRMKYLMDPVKSNGVLVRFNDVPGKSIDMTNLILVNEVN